MNTAQRHTRDTERLRAMRPLTIEQWAEKHIICVVTGTVDMLLGASWELTDAPDMDMAHEAIAAALSCDTCEGTGEIRDEDVYVCLECSICDGNGRHDHPVSHVLVSDRMGHWLRLDGEAVYDADVMGIQGDAKIWVRVGSGQEWCADTALQAAYQAMANSQKDAI